MSTELNKLFSLEGKKAMVIGGAGGIGQAIATGLAAYGADTAIASRNMDKLKAAAAEIEAKTGKKVRVYQVDVSDEKSIQDLVAATRADVGITDILVNSQGLNHKFKAEEQPMDEWDAMYAVNVRGLFICCKEFGKGMIEQNYGKIINIGSITGAEASCGDVAYATAKSGVMNGLTKSLALVGAPYGVRCCCVSPGPVLTRDAMANMKTLLGRAAEPQEIVDLIMYLASDKAAFITGENILIDGGRFIMKNKE